ncbi:MAG: hypothetical protein FJ279_12665 [Planctomycetes bacterium]|nr:hypothetical protein [Planctomycetota bacterium]
MWVLRVRVSPASPVRTRPGAAKNGRTCPLRLLLTLCLQSVIHPLSNRPQSLEGMRMSQSSVTISAIGLAILTVLRMGPAWAATDDGLAALPGTLFHAERFVGNAQIVQDDTAFGGKAVRGTRWYYFCQQVPFPQGAGEYHVYLRTKSDGTDNPIQLGTMQQGNLEILAAAPSPPPGRWKWIKFSPVQAKTVGPFFVIHGGGQVPSQWTMLDGIVITRQASLAAETLDRAMRTTPPHLGILTAPRAAAPPVIDGVLNDACYQLAPEAFPFVRLGQPRFAEAQTRVSAVWDDTNLYIAAQMDDQILNPVANRLGDFRRSVTQHDGPVWQDDCLEVFADPACEGRDYYQLVVNALGTIYDARGQDKGFESGAVAKSLVANGYWSVELSIPFRSMGIRAPSSGVVLGINFGRERYGEKEISSWSPLTRFAEPEGFGRVALVDARKDVSLSAPFSVRLRGFELFRFGDNVLSFTGTGKGHMTVFVDARVERAKPVRSAASGVVGEGRPPVDVTYSLAESGGATVQFLLVDDTSALPVYLSPLYPGEVAGTLAEVAMKSDGDIELFCNGERAAAGPAGKEVVVKVPLVNGLNAMAVKSSGVTLSGQIRAGDFEVPVDATWCWTPDADAISKSLDLDGIQKVVAEGAGVRARSPRGVFRKSIAVNATRAWPNYGEAMYLAQGAAQWFHLRLKGIRGLPMVKKPVVVVDVPEGIELIDGAGYYGKKRKTQPRFIREERGRVTLGSAAFQRTAFRSDLPIRTIDHVGILNFFSVTVRAREGGPLTPGSEARLYYHQEDCDGAIVEVPRVFPVRITGTLQGVPPKGITLQCWPGWMSTYDGEAGKDAILDTIAQAGFNDVTLGDDAPAAHRHEMRLTALVNFEPWVLDLAPYVKEHPAEALIDAKGKPSDRFICTTQLLGAAWDHFVDPAIGQWLGRLAPDHVNWDYESSAFTGYLVCYDDRCLDAFRKSVGLQAGVPLRSDLVKKDYHEAWLDFMAKRSSEVARRFRESIGKHRPSAMFSMYSGYQCPDTKETYNVDWALCAPHLDLVMCGYGRRIEEILATRRAAGNTPCVFGCITYPYEFNDDRAVSTITAAEALRRLCDARGGVLYYSLSNGDARTLLAFAKVSRVAAEFAEFFARGTEDRSGFAVTSGDKSDTYIFSLGKRKLLCLVNETGMPAHFEIECPGPARDFFSKGTLHRTQLRVDVPSRGIAVFTVGE